MIGFRVAAHTGGPDCRLPSPRDSSCKSCGLMVIAKPPKLRVWDRRAASSHRVGTQDAHIVHALERAGMGGRTLAHAAVHLSNRFVPMDRVRLRTPEPVYAEVPAAASSERNVQQHPL